MNCIHCNNTGVCSYCNGTGKSMTGMLDCIHCNGTGVCSFCHGQSAAKNQGTGFSAPRTTPQFPRGGQPTSNAFGARSRRAAPNENQGYLLPDGRDMREMEPDELVDAWIELMSGGKMMKLIVKTQIKSFKTFGSGLSGISKPLLTKLETGSSKEIMIACEIIGILKDKAQGLVIPVGELLFHKHAAIRKKAIEALSNIGKHAVAAEEQIKESLKDKDKDVAKKAKKLLKSLSKIKSDDREMIIEDEELAYNLLTEVKQMEQEKNNIDTSDLQPPDDDFSKYKNIFFMSHALPDFPWVKKAIDEITSWPNCYCWTCEKDISSGEDWLTEIYKGLDACNWYILFWSDKAKESKWTNEEIREAKTRNVSSGTPNISTVNLTGGDWPRLLSRYQGSVVKSDEDLKKWLENLKGQVKF